MAFAQTNFQGKLDNKTVYDFTKKLDYSLKQKDRIKLVEDLLYKDGNLVPYFQEYFDTYYKVNPGQTDPLSEDINVCKVLEKMTNYILFSPDAERITKKTKYNFYPEYKLKEKMNKEQSLEELVENTYQDIDYDSIDTAIFDEVINFVVVPIKNHKKEIKQTIYDKDLNDPKLKSVKNYQDFIDILHWQLEENKESDNNFGQKYKLIKTIKECKIDQLICKDNIKGTIYFKQVSPDSTEIDYQLFNFTNKEHVIVLLKCSAKGLESDIGILVYDLEKLLEECHLNETDLKALKLFRQGDFTFKEIAGELDLQSKNVMSRIDNIVNRVIKKYKEKYYDWIYLNWLKGNYKKCSQCGKIKLVQYFGKHPDTKDGCQSVCKKCDNLRKN
jgi:hypothetical protein